MDDTELRFIRAIRESPNDNTPREVYADYLRDKGEDNKAGYITLGILIERYKAAEATLPQDWKDTIAGCVDLYLIPLPGARTTLIPIIKALRQASIAWFKPILREEHPPSYTQTNMGLKECKDITDKMFLSTTTDNYQNVESLVVKGINKYQAIKAIENFTAHFDTMRLNTNYDNREGRINTNTAELIYRASTDLRAI